MTKVFRSMPESLRAFKTAATPPSRLFIISAKIFGEPPAENPTAPGFNFALVSASFRPCHGQWGAV